MRVSVKEAEGEGEREGGGLQGGQTTQDHTRLKSLNEWSRVLPPHFLSPTFFFCPRHNSISFVSNTFFCLSLGLVLFVFFLYVAECGEFTTFSFKYPLCAFR